MEEVIKELLADSSRKIVHVKIDKPLLPKLGSYVNEVIKVRELASSLKKRGIERFYSFQEEAIKAIRRGENVFIVAGTGTGKTEAFLLPLIERAIGNDKEIFLLIYPTKALARDQLDRIRYYTSLFFGVRVSVLDGDTPERERKRIYEYPPKFLISNPDMIHYSLQYSSSFRELMSKVSTIVMDDMHVYTGIFGTHVYYVLRRLERFTSVNPQYIGASATIGNPEIFASKLFKSKVRVIESKDVRKSPLYHILLKPVYRSKMAETISLIKFCEKKGLKTLIFVDSHRSAEIIKILAKRSGLSIEVHRAGLSREDRKEVEEKLKRGEICSVVSTPTLELGIDIGDLDAVILYNIPPSFSRYLQRIGRVGRRGQKSYTFVILGDDPISSFYERNPRAFFNREPEPQVLEPENEEIAKIHVLAMVRDMPVNLNNLDKFLREIALVLVREGLLKVKGSFLRITRKGIEFLRPRMSLRGVGEIVEIITAEGKNIGSREMPMALKELHPGAIYLHRGIPYLVIDLKKRKAIVKKIPGDPEMITYPLFYTLPEEGKIIEEKYYKGLKIRYLNLTITDSVYGYVVKKFPSMETLKEEILDKEHIYAFKTKGVSLEIQPVSHWSEAQNAEAFHAIEHAIISAAQVVAGLAPTDLGGVSFPSGHIYIYDSYPGGSGASRILYEKIEEGFSVAFEITSNCECEDGCPRCIYSPYCGNNNKVLSRKRAVFILEKIIKVGVKYLANPRYGKPLV